MATPWIPIGPDFVFAPRDGNFKRLSRFNEWGRQGLAESIAIDPTDPNVIYVADTPTSGGTGLFRTDNDGGSWSSLLDTLQMSDPGGVNPNCVIIHPTFPNIIYICTWSGGVYKSIDRGQTWGPRVTPGGTLRQLLIDPRTAADPATTVLFVVSTDGLFRSGDGGSTWVSVLADNVMGLVAYTPPTGTAHFYASVWQKGLFHATDPTTTWTNLNTQGIGLPSRGASPDDFDWVLVDYCRQNPDRLYAWVAQSGKTLGLYTSAAGLNSWTKIAATTPPDPGQGFYSYFLCVAPNSPGDGNNDILFFGSTGLFRSIDSGQTWQGDATGYHADQHSLVFYPEAPPAGVIPMTYVGCDGGIAACSRFADPTYPFATAQPDFAEQLKFADNGSYQNYNHARQCSAVYQYTSHPALGALGYIGCQDTGVAAGSGALGWRGIMDADSGGIAAAPGPDGVAVWANTGAWDGWPGFRISGFKDKGEFGPSFFFCTLGSGGPLLASTCNFTLGTDDLCLTGAIVRDSDRTLSNAINVTTPAVRQATPSSMAGISVNTAVVVDVGSTVEETVTVTATTATTFTATFGQSHASGVPVQLARSFVTQVGFDGVAAQISQDFGASNVGVVAASPVDPNVLFAQTNDQRLWFTNTGSTANASTVWTEVAGGKPANVQIGAIAVDAAGTPYVLLVWAVTAGMGSGITTPLFRIAGGNWIPISCNGLPAGSFGYGNLEADPVVPARFYASNGVRVYTFDDSAGAATWIDISSGLPGQWIYDLWIANVGTASNPRIILRAAIPTRGVWETDVSADGGRRSGPFLYVRDNVLDQGWPGLSPDGVPNPYDPSNDAATLYHYQCADIKVDAKQSGGGTIADFFQTDPEAGAPPISHVFFDQLQDNSSDLPQSDAALVHVQVHNRGTSANNVRVWTMYCNASAGVPALSASASNGNAFDFWSQFTATGQIIPNLPTDSPWKSVGSPQTLSGIDPATPKVASWAWTVPTLGTGDPGHYCMVTFVHSAVNPISESSVNVDEMTPRNRQIGQKNLHIGAPIPPGGTPKGGGIGGQPGGRKLPGTMREFIEFHNPTMNRRIVDLVFDLRGLSKLLTFAFQLTTVKTLAPLKQSLSGVTRTRKAAAGGKIKMTPALEPLIYDAQPGAIVTVRGVVLPPFGTCVSAFVVGSTGRIPANKRFTLQVQQRTDGRVIGGSVYIVRIGSDGKRRRTKVLMADSHNPKSSHAERGDIEQAAEALRYLPPWARQIVDEREKQLMKE